MGVGEEVEEGKGVGGCEVDGGIWRLVGRAAWRACWALMVCMEEMGKCASVMCV